MNPRYLKALIFGCAFAMLTAAFGMFFGPLIHAAPTQASGAGKTFTFRIPGEPETLDWNRAHTPIETYILLNIMEGLVAFDSKLNVTPSLAQTWTLSQDGRTYTFKLKPGVKWSDGEPLRAQDFVYSWKRLLSPMTAASYAYFLFDIEGAELYNKGTLKDFSGVGIRAIDDLTFQVKLSRPVAHWIQIPTFWVTFPLREDIVEKYGSGWETPGHMVTLGPYMLASHDFDSKILLKANPTYHGLRGNIDQVVGLIVKDDSTALSLYDAGKIDFLTDISAIDLQRLQGNPDLHAYPYLKTGYLGMLVSKYPMIHAKVRRAIAMAIDKSKLGEILHGRQKPATSFVPPPLMGYSPKVGLPYNPTLAKAELRSAGLDLSRELSLDLILPNWDKPNTIAQFIQAQLKQNLGITVNVNPFDNKTFRAQLDLHTFPLFEATWSADYPDPDNILSIFLSSSGNNRANWKSEKFDDLILNARSLSSRAAREKNYFEAQRLLLEQDAVIVPLYYEPNMAMVRPRVQGLELNPLNYLLLKKVTLAN